MELAREVDAGGARPDHQQPFTRADASHEPGKRDAPPDDARRHEHRGNREHAAPENGRREPVINDREKERRRAERLKDSNEQLAAIDH